MERTKAQAESELRVRLIAECKQAKVQWGLAKTEIQENAEVKMVVLPLAGKGMAGAKQRQDPQNTQRSNYWHNKQAVTLRLELLEISKMIWRRASGKPHIKYTQEGRKIFRCRQV